MFVPLHDDNPLRSISRAYVTISLILVNVVIFGWQTLGASGSELESCRSLAASFAVVPRDMLSVGVVGGAARGPCDLLAVPEVLTLVSYSFLHGDPFHLVGNMLFLWVFGDNVEDAMGHLRFAVFYVLCAVCGGLAHVFAVQSIHPQDAGVALIGASGAVSGVIAAYLLLYPHVRVWVLAFRFIPLRISAMLALGVWIVTQMFMVLLPLAGPIAWWAHIGGIVAGALLIIPMRRPGVRLLNPAPSAVLVYPPEH